MFHLFDTSVNKCLQKSSNLFKNLIQVKQTFTLKDHNLILYEFNNTIN